MSDKIEYLIVAGANKCGTTSVFNYLSAHPAVCATRGKQADYFLKNDYSWAVHSGQPRFQDNSDTSYDDCFKKAVGNQHVRLDVSPDYMYCDQAAESIADVCGNDNVRIIFILRDPVTRFYSWYKFARQQGLIEANTPIEDFLGMQLPEGSDTLVESVLVTGCYSKFLAEYISVFGADRIKVCFYEDLQKDPEAFTKSICIFSNLDDSFYSGYDFKHFNKSQTVRFPIVHRLYIGCFRMVRAVLSKSETAMTVMQPLLSKLSTTYRKANMHDTVVNSMPAAVEAELRIRYSTECEKLLNMGIQHNWK